VKQFHSSILDDASRLAANENYWTKPVQTRQISLKIQLPFGVAQHFEDANMQAGRLPGLQRFQPAYDLLPTMPAHGAIPRDISFSATPVASGQHTAHTANRSAARALAFAASSSRFFGGAVVCSDCSNRADTAATSSTAVKNAASFAFDGLVNPLILRTNCNDAARISSSVTGGSKLKRILMFRHILWTQIILAGREQRRPQRQ
jgi:hypothetical protein